MKNGNCFYFFFSIPRAKLLIQIANSLHLSGMEPNQSEIQNFIGLAMYARMQRQESFFFFQ